MCSLFSLSMVINTFQLVVIGNQYPKKSVDSTTQIYTEVTRPLYTPTNKHRKSGWVTQDYVMICYCTIVIAVRLIIFVIVIITDFWVIVIVTW